MSRKAGLLLALACWCAPSVAVTVLGVPMGEMLNSPPQACPSKKDSAKQICWVGRPSTARDGTKTGTLHLPGRPKWAAKQTFTGSVSKDDTIEELKLPKVAASERSAIILSVNEQLGTPRAAGDQGSTAWARWATKGVHVNLACEEANCLLTVRTDAAEAVARRQAEGRRTTDAGNPRTP
jgi:hypothetical protein